jgi:hypothetical protein
MTAFETIGPDYQTPYRILSYGQQHPCNGHIDQLIIWQIQRKTHAFDVPEPPEEL